MKTQDPTFKKNLLKISVATVLLVTGAALSFGPFLRNQSASRASTPQEIAAQRKFQAKLMAAQAEFHQKVNAARTEAELKAVLK